MHTPSRAATTDCDYQDDSRGVADIMLAAAHKLVSVGADFLICPDNTIHHALPFVLSRSPCPWLHIAETVANEAVARGFRRLGLVGTRWLVESAVHPDVLSARDVSFVRPERVERDEMNRIIIEELVCGIVRSQAVAWFQRVITHMRDAGCAAVVLGCTEIPLIMQDENSPPPTLDSTRLLARAALRRAVA